MKKNKGLAYAALLITFILFNIIAFVVPTEKTATFWIAYAFSFVAFILQIAVWNIAFRGTKTLKSKFLGISLIAVSSIYFSVQIAAFVIFMVFPTIAGWVAVIACSLILGVSLICLIGTEVARDEIVRVESKVEKKVFYRLSLPLVFKTFVTAPHLIRKFVFLSLKKSFHLFYASLFKGDNIVRNSDYILADARTLSMIQALLKFYYSHIVSVYHDLRYL